MDIKIDITTDPRPEFPNHDEWDKLLHSVPTLFPTNQGEVLNRALYMVRGAGARLEQIDGRYKIRPMYEPEGHWRNESEWMEWAVPTLTRFKDEIKKCLENLSEHVRN